MSHTKSGEKNSKKNKKNVKKTTPFITRQMYGVIWYEYAFSANVVIHNMFILKQLLILHQIEFTFFFCIRLWCYLHALIIIIVHMNNKLSFPFKFISVLWMLLQSGIFI